MPPSPPLRDIIRGANELQNMENRLRLVAGAAGDVESIQQRLFDVALADPPAG